MTQVASLRIQSDMISCLVSASFELFTGSCKLVDNINGSSSPYAPMEAPLVPPMIVYPHNVVGDRLLPGVMDDGMLSFVRERAGQPGWTYWVGQTRTQRQLTLAIRQ
jgi:hypothetical protein